jgi:hypothetical protein
MAGLRGEGNPLQSAGIATNLRQAVPLASNLVPVLAVRVGVVVDGLGRVDWTRQYQRSLDTWRPTSHILLTRAA